MKICLSRSVERLLWPDRWALLAVVDLSYTKHLIVNSFGIITFSSSYKSSD
jgi:hypothetical protein